MFPLVRLVLEPPGAPVTWWMPTSTMPYIVTLLPSAALCAMPNDEKHPSTAADRARILFITCLLLLHEIGRSPRHIVGSSGFSLGDMSQAVTAGSTGSLEQPGRTDLFSSENVARLQLMWATQQALRPLGASRARWQGLGRSITHRKPASRFLAKFTLRFNRLYDLSSMSARRATHCPSPTSSCSIPILSASETLCRSRFFKRTAPCAWASACCSPSS